MKNELTKSLSYKKQKDFWRRVASNKLVYLMMLPGLLIIIIFRYLPMFGIVIAFLDYKPWEGILGSKWVGLQFFRDAFSQVTFSRAFLNTVLISFMNLIFTFPMPIILALLLNEVKHIFFKRSVQTISYLPFFLSWIVVSAFVMNFLSSDFGLINKFLVSMGQQPVNWYNTLGIWRWILVFLNVWKGVGWGTIIFLAAISGISPELYEAAAIDGCGRFKRILHITLPSLAPTIVILLILNMGSLISGNFEQIWALVGNNSVLAEDIDIIDTFVYRVGFLQAKFSFASAIGLFRSIVSFILVFSANRISAQFQKEENFKLF